MSQLYFLAVNGQQTGPFTINEIKEKNIQKDTLIWIEGTDIWTKAENIPLLKDVLLATQPTLTTPETKTNSHKISPPPISNDKYFGYDLATLEDRLFANILDGLIHTAPTLVFLGNSDNLYSLWSIVGSVIVSAIYGAFCYPIWGGNIGHKIMDLKVISAENGEIEYNSYTGSTREVLKSIFGLFVIPIVWLLWDEDRQNLYDKVAKTYVVKNK